MIDIEALRREATTGARDDIVAVDRGWLRLVLDQLTGQSPGASKASAA